MRVSLPEQVWVELRPAGFGSRCLAFLVDMLILIVAELLLVLCIVFISEFVLSDRNPISRLLGDASAGGSWFDTGAVLAVVMFAIAWGYHVFFELFWHGLTPGKRIFGLRTVNEEGLSPSFQASAIRNLLRVIDFLPFGGVVALVSMLLTERAQRVGDLAAGTLVVYDLESELEDYARDESKSQNASLLVPVLEYNLLESFIRRRANFTTEARVFTATELAKIFIPLSKGANGPLTMENEGVLEWVYNNSAPAKNTYRDGSETRTS